MPRRALVTTLRDASAGHPQPSRWSVIGLSLWATALVLAGVLTIAGRTAPADRSAIALEARPAVAVDLPPSTTSTTTSTTAVPTTTTAPPVPTTTAATAPPPVAAPRPRVLTPVTAPPATAPPATAPAPAPVSPEPAATNVDAATEQQLLDDHNAHRADAGLPPLVRDPCLDAIAREWSAHMRSGRTLAHNPSLGAQMERCIAWSTAAENVGYAGSASELAAQFWNSAEHRPNIVGDHQYVGIGVVVGDDGLRWATIDFAG